MTSFLGENIPVSCAEYVRLTMIVNIRRINGNVGYIVYGINSSNGNEFQNIVYVG